MPNLSHHCNRGTNPFAHSPLSLHQRGTKPPPNLPVFAQYNGPKPCLSNQHHASKERTHYICSTHQHQPTQQERTHFQAHSDTILEERTQWPAHLHPSSAWNEPILPYLSHMAPPRKEGGMNPLSWHSNLVQRNQPNGPNTRISICTERTQ